jgi:hypothetical protein
LSGTYEIIENGEPERSSLRGQGDRHTSEVVTALSAQNCPQNRFLKPELLSVDKPDRRTLGMKGVFTSNFA